MKKNALLASTDPDISQLFYILESYYQEHDAADIRDGPGRSADSQKKMGKILLVQFGKILKGDAYQKDIEAVNAWFLRDPKKIETGLPDLKNSTFRQDLLSNGMLEFYLFNQKEKLGKSFPSTPQLEQFYSAQTHSDGCMHDNFFAVSVADTC